MKKKIKKNNVAVHVRCIIFRCLVHFQSQFDISAMNDGTRKALLVFGCKMSAKQIKTINIVLKYRFEVTILGKMYRTFLVFAQYIPASCMLLHLF